MSLGTIGSVFCPIHREGHIFIGAFFVATLVFFAIWSPLGWLGVIATCWCIYFFRDPDRTIPQKKGVVVSPGDGIVSMIEHAPPPPELEMGDEPLTRVSVFLNVFNVHINRIPIAGKISKINYHPGKFLNAAMDKASEDNERNSVVVTTQDGKDVIFVQIAGLVARRIVSYLKDDQEVKTGERYGLIRFGSRVDIYLPAGANPLVAVGQVAVGGETIIANINSDEETITGEKL